jgi:hypothetical protein
MLSKKKLSQGKKHSLDRKKKEDYIYEEDCKFFDRKIY